MFNGFHCADERIPHPSRLNKPPIETSLVNLVELERLRAEVIKLQSALDKSEDVINKLMKTIQELDADKQFFETELRARNADIEKYISLGARKEMALGLEVKTDEPAKPAEPRKSISKKKVQAKTLERRWR